jgi:hypothetical protein
MPDLYVIFAHNHNRNGMFLSMFRGKAAQTERKRVAYPVVTYSYILTSNKASLGVHKKLNKMHPGIWETKGTHTMFAAKLRPTTQLCTRATLVSTAEAKGIFEQHFATSDMMLCDVDLILLHPQHIGTFSVADKGGVLYASVWDARAFGQFAHGQQRGDYAVVHNFFYRTHSGQTRQPSLALVSTLLAALVSSAALSGVFEYAVFDVDCNSVTVLAQLRQARPELDCLEVLGHCTEHYSALRLGMKTPHNIISGPDSYSTRFLDPRDISTLLAFEPVTNGPAAKL